MGTPQRWRAGAIKITHFYPEDTSNLNKYNFVHFPIFETVTHRGHFFLHNIPGWSGWGVVVLGELGALWGE